MLVQTQLRKIQTVIGGWNINDMRISKVPYHGENHHTDVSLSLAIVKDTMKLTRSQNPFTAVTNFVVI